MSFVDAPSNLPKRRKFLRLPEKFSKQISRSEEMPENKSRQAAKKSIRKPLFRFEGHLFVGSSKHRTQTFYVPPARRNDHLLFSRQLRAFAPSRTLIGRESMSLNNEKTSREAAKPRRDVEDVAANVVDRARQPPLDSVPGLFESVQDYRTAHYKQLFPHSPIRDVTFFLFSNFAPSRPRGHRSEGQA